MNKMAPPEEIYLADTVTKLLPEHRDRVVITGSHGGVYAGYCAAKMHVRAAIFNDAGIGKDQAGIGSLEYLDGLGLAAAAVDSQSCRIADAADMWANGTVSAVNAVAARLGCITGESVSDCALRLRQARSSSLPVPTVREARFVISDRPKERKVIGIDSASLFEAEDGGHIVITGSHGGLVGGSPKTLILPSVHAVFYNDAGGCKDGSGFSRLPVLEARGIAAGTVSNESAKIGDATSCYEDGILSRANAVARNLGAEIGMPLRQFVESLKRL
jgi:hypothetical protein